jgi:hypothetical protein
MIEFVLRAAAWGLSPVAGLFHRGWKRIGAMFSDKGDFPPTAGAFARMGDPLFDGSGGAQATPEVEGIAFSRVP